MTCKEGAKIYCKNSWRNGGYTSEADCLEHVDEHDCGDSSCLDHIKTVDRSALVVMVLIAGVIGAAVGYAYNKMKGDDK